MARLLGVDIGTSGTKTVLFDEYGTTLASATAEYPLYQPHIGWAEQDPEDWWRATAQTIAQVLQKSDTRGDEVTGVGLSGQMHGMVLLGADNEVIRPAIIWCDQRTQKQCDDITDIIGRERLIQITANPAITGFTASKIMWVKQNQPEIYDKIAKDPASQGLHPLPPDGRICDRSVRRKRYAAFGRSESLLEPRGSGKARDPL